MNKLHLWTLPLDSPEVNCGIKTFLLRQKVDLTCSLSKMLPCLESSFQPVTNCRFKLCLQREKLGSVQMKIKHLSGTVERAARSKQISEFLAPNPVFSPHFLHIVPSCPSLEIRYWNERPLLYIVSWLIIILTLTCFGYTSSLFRSFISTVPLLVSGEHAEMGSKFLKKDVD